MFQEKTVKDKEEKKEALPKKLEKAFKGKYISVIGRRKTSVAQVRLYQKREGIIIVNDLEPNKYFIESYIKIINQPLKLAGLKDVNISIKVKGGGKKSQAEAARLGIARALVKMDKELKPSLKAKGLLTRDARCKERKKPGLKKARRAPQWSKR